VHIVRRRLCGGNVPDPSLWLFDIERLTQGRLFRSITGIVATAFFPFSHLDIP
jgi:hypothetical protein